MKNDTLKEPKRERMGMNTKKGTGGLKCVIVGDGAVGKTSLLLSYTTGGIMMDYIPTCFDCYTVDMKVKDKSYTMSLIDTAGQETYDRLRTLSYYDSDVFVVCFSIADADSFENIRDRWIPELRQYRPDTPFILVGTQADHRDTSKELENLLSETVLSEADDTDCKSRRVSSSTSTSVKSDIPKECVPYKKAKSLAKKCGARAYMECSALEGTGVREVVSAALNTALSPKKKHAAGLLKSVKSAFHFRKHHSKTTEAKTTDL